MGEWAGRQANRCKGKGDGDVVGGVGGDILLKISSLFLFISSLIFIH